MKKNIVLAATVAAATTLSACSTTHPDVIHPREAQQLSQVLDATVLTVRPVVVDGSQSGAGAVAGGLIGSVAGASVHSYPEAQVVSVIGAVLGAVLGNAIERSATREEAVELLLQLRNGERRAIVQARSPELLNPGEAVILVTSGGRTRVLRAPVGSPGGGAANTPVGGPART
ncbi:glycine zipper domain-containing protein [Roseateles violae]|uniref:Glycine zipper domain-containing protein n=1 Tax=Roseateles violae TaxID=3058042 RepID=A0ABT8DVS1_9BURK|nr:glycine zipper domain-containing protein [Pelomonas sp. PFR6]MDN3922312.1 glycine zipper domain-containing protein [Pelomonas sp. PFR6]